ncbi:MAG: hypothetical protein MJH10_20915 [Epibacterium sp.]|nr:hypothetical protein [Epibacterium sp.]NQX75920.1 hypothetical protein [Epibacterium sp.]
MFGLSKLWSYVVAVLAVLGGLFGIYTAGKHHARQEATQDALEGQIETRERIDNAPMPTSERDALEFLRDRQSKRDLRRD